MIYGRVQLEDEYLAQLAAEGDREALGAIVTRYRHYVYTIAYKIVPHPDDAFDITQNTFLKLVAGIGGYKSQRRFRPWLATIAIHEAMSFARSSQKRELALPPDRLNWLIDRRQAPEGAKIIEVIERNDRRRMVEQMIGELSPQQRSIMILYLTEDLRPKEIAERLGIPASQVTTQVRRAMVRLRSIMEEVREPSREAEK
ncbi:RNA polymerase sigma factor [Candidatus Sumerlaeota bacterium]|nr:RNA polymerase sigma factor [Candidatus Sumerlaeota bacterium]MBI3736781.1 RNA polymerase sigma factor [Candidatus Sumerlaeota bacterium]